MMLGDDKDEGGGRSVVTKCGDVEWRTWALASDRWLEGMLDRLLVLLLLGRTGVVDLLRER